MEFLFSFFRSMAVFTEHHVCGRTERTHHDHESGSVITSFFSNAPNPWTHSLQWWTLRSKQCHAIIHITHVLCKTYRRRFPANLSGSQRRLLWKKSLIIAKCFGRNTAILKWSIRINRQLIGVFRSLEQKSRFSFSCSSYTVLKTVPT